MCVPNAIRMPALLQPVWFYDPVCDWYERIYPQTGRRSYHIWFWGHTRIPSVKRKK